MSAIKKYYCQFDDFWNCLFTKKTLSITYDWLASESANKGDVSCVTAYFDWIMVDGCTGVDH